MKHAEGFYKLGYDVEILVLQSFTEYKKKIKIKNIHNFYGISKKIRIHYFNDYLPFFFKDCFFIGTFCIILFSALAKIIPKIKCILNPYRKISNYCKKKKFDFTYCRNLESVALFNIHHKIPTIIENHRIYKESIPKAEKILYSISKNVYFKGIVTIHKSLGDKFEKLNVPRKKILILEDAVDINKFQSISDNKISLRKKLKLPLNKKLITYSGKLIEGRGVNIIINSANILRDNNLVFLIIGGTKDDIKKWEVFIKKKNISADILFLGFINHSLIPYYLKASDVLLAPYSLGCKTVNWMSPLKIFEFKAAKVPIIASDVSRLREICNNYECLFFEVDNPIDLSEKIKLIIKDKDLQFQLIKNAYQKVINNSYEKRCNQIIKFAELENRKN